MSGPGTSHPIPNFREDERAQQQYKASLDRRIKAYHSEAEAEVRRVFTQKRESINAELKASELMIESRQKAAAEAAAAYRQRYPARMNRGRPARPSFVESLLSFGKASRLYNRVVQANGDVIDAQSNQRRLAHKADELDNEMGRALNAALEKAKATTASVEWLNEIHRDRALAEMKKRVDEIDAERTNFARRLEQNRVNDEELRDRTFAEMGVEPVDIPLTGIMFYKVLVFGDLAYFVLRDLEKKLFALPYDPRLETIIDGVFDVYRVADGLDVRQRVHTETKVPFTPLDHFFVCCDKQDIVARAEYREQRQWIKQNRGLPPTPSPSQMDRDVIKLLADFSETIPPPRAPVIDR